MPLETRDDTDSLAIKALSGLSLLAFWHLILHELLHLLPQEKFITMNFANPRRT